MNDEEKRLRDAFLAIEMPSSLNEKTLHYIETHRESSAVDTPCAANKRRVADERSVTGKCCANKESFSASVAPKSSPDEVHEEKPVMKAHRGGKKRGRDRWRIVAALAACFCLAFAGMGGYAYATPSAYVSVEAPIGMALRVNCFDIVVGVEGFDGNALDERLYPADVVNELMGKPYSDALDIIAQRNQELGFASGSADDSVMDISIISNNQQQIETLQQKSEHCMNTHGMHGHCQFVASDQQQAAAEAGMGVARYLAAQELLTLDASLTLDDCRAMTMAEVRGRIAELGGEAPSIGTGVGCGSGEGEGRCSGGNGSNADSESRGHGGGHGRGNGSGGHGKHGVSSESVDSE